MERVNELAIGLDSRHGVYEELNHYFSDQSKEEKEILETREILGDSSEKLTDQEVHSIANEIQYLVDSWLQEFEEEVFRGKTLNGLLGLNINEYK